ncbi:MAG TPA: hypothetical protein PKD49_09170 [Hyphomicrobium sp.]|nr:hypothetical protein [Hyphomicrobium sp.]
MKLKYLMIFATALAFALPMQPIEANAKAKKAHQPLRGVIYGKQRRVGGYTYKYVDGIDTRKFNDPALSFRSQGGPFDNGFFFETPRPPFGGYTPYMH